jgi:hypothetical protein
VPASEEDSDGAESIVQNSDSGGENEDDGGKFAVCHALECLSV